MRYFSGFCLKGENELFDEFICKSELCVVGFSYGAQKALEYTLTCKERIDKLQLISPAFFMDKGEKFKKLQTLYFKKNPEQYCHNFLENITYPSTLDIKKYFKQDNLVELEELLSYNWDIDDLNKVKEKGVDIEVYLGSLDKIIDSLHVKNFFKEYATTYYIKNVGHTLRGE